MLVTLGNASERLILDRIKLIDMSQTWLIRTIRETWSSCHLAWPTRIDEHENLLWKMLLSCLGLWWVVFSHSSGLMWFSDDHSWREFPFIVIDTYDGEWDFKYCWCVGHVSIVLRRQPIAYFQIIDQKVSPRLYERNMRWQDNVNLYLKTSRWDFSTSFRMVFSTFRLAGDWC